MMNPLTDLSLRAKITVSFMLIVLGGAAISTLGGSLIVTNAMRNEAMKRVRQGVSAAEMLYRSRTEATRKAVSDVAANDRVLDAVRAGRWDQLPQVLASLRESNELDLVSVVPLQDSAAAGAPPVPDSLSGMVRAAQDGRVSSGTEVFTVREVLRHNPSLARKLLLAVPGEDPPPSSLQNALTLVAAAPLRIESATAGMVYGGILLNGNDRVVDQTAQLVFGSDISADPDLGTISMFMGGLRVSTNARGAGGARALGTAVPPEVAKAILEESGSWHGRIFVDGSWQIAAYEPLRSASGDISGILSVAMHESPFLQVRTDMMLTFLLVAAVGVVVVLVLTYAITRTMIHPLEEMVAASDRIAAGDLDHSVNVRSRDEVGLLANSFNKMVVSLKTMKLELEEWGRTLEEKVKTRTEELVSVRIQMAQSEKLASIGRLAAGVAHEINNPLGGILTFSMLALEDCDANHPMRHNLEIIVKQTLRCRETVKGLLDFARQSSSRPSETDVNSVIDKTLSLLEKQSIFHDIRTVRQLTPDPPPVLIDAGQLQQVIVNMVLNAVDAMEESGTLTVQTDVDARDQHVLIRITDTGRGIPDDVLPFIFEPFFTTKKVGKGTGLGLSIVHGIVTGASGRIEVSSSPKGASFTVRLPIAQPADSSRQPPSEASHPA